jgi:hypothetical protein
VVAQAGAWWSDYLEACRGGAWLHPRGRNSGGLGDATVSWSWCLALRAGDAEGQGSRRAQVVEIPARHASGCSRQSWGPAGSEGGGQGGGDPGGRGSGMELGHNKAKGWGSSLCMDLA